MRVQTHARGRAHRLATLTDIELRSGDADRAAATAVEMVETVQGMESRRLRDRLVTVRNSLASQGSAGTTDAEEMIDEVLSLPV